MGLSHRYLVLASAVPALCLLAALHAAIARADRPVAADSGKADQLFDQGKQRMAQQDYAAACPLLAQSFELDPATGSLLALALCHEREGKLATAYREYAQAGERSRKEQRADREAAARVRAAALQPKLSTLTIHAAAAADDLEVRVDGTLIEPASLDKPLPLDGGDHVVIASAPHKQPWSAQLTLAKSDDSKTLDVAALQDLPPVGPIAAPVSVPAHRKPAPGTRDPERGLSAGQWIGIGTIGMGFVGLGLGAYYSLRAAHDDDATRTCDADVCTYRAKKHFGDTAALSFVVGGSLAVTGLVMCLLSKQPAPTESAASVRPWTAAAWVAPRAGGAALQGRF